MHIENRLDEIIKKQKEVRDKNNHRILKKIKEECPMLQAHLELVKSHFGGFTMQGLKFK